MNIDKINKVIENSGVTEYGYGYLADVEDYRYKHLPYAISIIVKLSNAVVDEIENEPTFSYFHHYRTVNSFIDQALLKIGMEIEKQGYKYMPVGASQTVNNLADKYSGIFQHKTAARLAGLGGIGKSGLFISYKYGARVRLGTILTDMTLPTVKPKDIDICTGCNACVKACPAMALTGNGWNVNSSRDDIISAKACSDYMKDKFKHIGRGVVCGICMKVCNPFCGGKKID